MTAPKDATDATLRAHAALRAGLPADDGQDFADAQRGFIGTIPDEIGRAACRERV